MNIAFLFFGIVLFGLGVPIFIVFVLSAGGVCFFGLHLPWSVLANIAIGSVNGSTLLALPMFVLAGTLMLESGSAKKLIDMCLAFTGHVSGGLAITTVIASAFFGALSGSSLASVVAIGSIMIPQLVEHGYGRGFACAVVGVSSTLSLIIPPSTNFIIYGSITNVSVGKIFLAGVIPGIILAGALSIACFIMCRKIPRMPRMPWRERGKVIWTSWPVAFMPVIVLGGIYTGAFTATEAGAIACWWALILGVVIYRTLTWKKLYNSLKDAAISSAMIFVLIASATFFSTALNYMKIPQGITQFFIDQSVSRIGFLFICALIWFILGFFVDAVADLYITLPVMFPIAMAYGISPYQFAVCEVFIVAIGLYTPPVAVGLYTVASVGKAEPMLVIRKAIPLLAVMIAIALLFIVWPWPSTFLPGLTP